MASKFGTAFAAARKAGKKTFTFNGKSYTTKVAKETPKSAPVPSAAPRGKSGAAQGASGKVSTKSGASRSASGKASVKAKPAPSATPAKKPGLLSSMKQDTGKYVKASVKRAEDRKKNQKAKPITGGNLSRRDTGHMTSPNRMGHQ